MAGHLIYPRNNSWPGPWSPQAPMAYIMLPDASIASADGLDSSKHSPAALHICHTEVLSGAIFLVP